MWQLSGTFLSDDLELHSLQGQMKLQKCEEHVHRLSLTLASWLTSAFRKTTISSSGQKGHQCAYSSLENWLFKSQQFFSGNSSEYARKLNLYLYLRHFVIDFKG